MSFPSFFPSFFSFLFSFRLTTAPIFWAWRSKSQDNRTGRDRTAGAKIKVIGVGGGSNAINTMIEAGLMGVEFIVVIPTPRPQEVAGLKTLSVGQPLTKGLAGANPEVGREAALEDRERLAELLVGADMVFVNRHGGGPEPVQPRDAGLPRRSAH